MDDELLLVGDKYPVCKDKRKCFAKRVKDDHVVCSILTSTYSKKRPCPFCKAVREKTRGKIYDYNPITSKCNPVL